MDERRLRDAGFSADGSSSPRARHEPAPRPARRGRRWQRRRLWPAAHLGGGRAPPARCYPADASVWTLSAHPIQRLRDLCARERPRDPVYLQRWMLLLERHERIPRPLPPEAVEVEPYSQDGTE